MGIFNFKENILSIKNAGANKSDFREQLEGKHVTAGKKKKLNRKIEKARQQSKRAFLKLLVGTTVVLGGGAAAGYGILNGEDEKPEAAKPVSSPAPSRENQKFEMMSEAEARDVYDRGFDLVMSSVPDDASSENVAVKMLSFLKKFREKSVGWVEMRDGGYYSLEEGKFGAYLAVGNEEYRNPNALSIDSKENVLCIAPARITDLWAGIVLVHELSHLKDVAIGAESKTPSREEYIRGEVSAYSVELFLVDLLSGYKFRKIAEELVEENQYKTVDDIVELFKSKDFQKLDEIWERFDVVVGSGPAKSKTEKALRGSLYLMALAFAFVNKNSNEKSNRDIVKGYEYIVEKVYDGTNVLPRK